MSSVISMNIQLWRQKSLDGTITRDELKAAMAAIRKERTGASGVSDSSREKKATAAVKAKVAKPDGDSLLAELM